MNNKKLIWVFITALMGGIIGGSTISYFMKTETPQPAAQPAPVQLTSFPEHLIEHPDFITTSTLVTPAVVHIKTVGNTNTEKMQKELPNFDPFRDFFELHPMPQGPQTGFGSGVILSSNGYIVTNNHVIEGADKIEVTLNDKKTYNATVIGTDPSTDLALLKIEATNLAFLNWGNSDAVQVGEWVLAVGNPFNLTSTVTAGIISAKARDIEILKRNSVESFLQTDAAVNPGNSGGALVNVKGELIGINTAIASATGSYTGYSFAVPSDLAKKVISDLMKYGSVKRGYLGISIRNLDGPLAEEEGLKISEGVYVQGFAENSAGDAAGIKKGDVIIKVDNTIVKSIPELQEQISRHLPGDKVTLLVNRKGDIKTFAVTLRDGKGRTNITADVEDDVTEMFGANFEVAPKKELSSLSIQNGVKVSKIMAGKLREAGMREGFIITKIADIMVKTPKEVIGLLKSKKGGILIEGFYPNGQKAYYGVGL